ARIKARRDLADILAQRLAVAQIGRARELLDLPAGVVDIVFARYVVAGERQKVAERIAKDSTPAVADMHGAGRIGRHVLDVHPLPLADIGAAVFGALVEDALHEAMPDVRGHREVQEAWASHLDPRKR